MKIHVTIEKVEVFDGKDFNGTNWNHKMQVIITEKGLFLDNLVGNCLGSPSNIKWKGIDWKQYIGQTVEIMVVNCVGKEIASSHFKHVYTVEDLKRNCSNHNWAYPLFLLGPPF